MTTKNDFITSAYERLRISGITVIPSAANNTKALNRLENMAAEWFGRNIDAGYNFEDTPDLNSLHNIERKYWDAFESNLAIRLMPDFGKGMQPDPVLIQQASGALSFLVSDTIKINPIQYPRRMSIGRGNRIKGLGSFFAEDQKVPSVAKTNTMYINDISTFVEHFDAYLADSETISSFTISATTGLTINSSTNSDPDIDYTIKADGANDTDLYQVKIVITTSSGRKQTRIINFKLLDSEI